MGDLPLKPHAGILAYSLLLFMGVVWGLSLSLLKLASISGGHPVGLAFWQVCVGGTIMLVVSISTYGIAMPRRDVLRFSFVCGAVGVAFPAFALFWAAIHLPAGIVAIAFAAMPMFTFLMSVVFRVERGDRWRFVGVAIGLAAMAIVILPDESLPAPGLAPWVLLAFAAILSMSFENFYAGGFRPPAASSVQLSCGRQLGAVFILAPIALFTGTSVSATEPWGTLQWAATGTGVLSCVAFTTLLYVIRTSGPIFATQSSYIITLAGVAWGMAFFGERHSTYIWIAIALTMLSVGLVNPRSPRTSRRESGGVTRY